MIQFLIPDYTIYPNLIKLLWLLQTENPEIFLPNRSIGGTYDFLARSILNGGRCRFEGPDIYECYYLYDEYDELGIPLCHTCTNGFITEHDCYDKLSNRWLKYTENPRNRIITQSDIFLQYIKQQYPQYKITYSTLHPNNDELNFYNSINNSDDIIVLNYKFNNDDEFLSKIKNPSQIEIICGEPCVDNCPRRREHQILINKLQQGDPEVKDFYRKSYCTYCDNSSLFFNSLFTNSNALTNDRIDELYNQFGFSRFKISGRGEPLNNIIDKCLYYLIKPEYRDLLREHILFTLQKTGA